MDLRRVNRAVSKAHSSDPLPLSPSTLPVPPTQLLQHPYAATSGHRFDASDPVDDVEIQRPTLA
jgi:hypothetical protein